MAWPNDVRNGETAKQVLRDQPAHNIKHWADQCISLLQQIKARADYWCDPAHVPVHEDAAHVDLVSMRSRLEGLKNHADSELYLAWREVDNPGGGGD